MPENPTPSRQPNMAPIIVEFYTRDLPEGEPYVTQACCLDYLADLVAHICAISEGSVLRWVAYQELEVAPGSPELN